ncbi:MAG TPA: copper resistance CopC family protein [Actinoplanes sp.]|nr:copper resistance CopC family protein [Actinoplanes sp.]
MNKTRLLVALAAILAVLLPSAPAFAHNALTDASPAKGSTVKKAPTSVKLKFLQKLNPDYTTITVTGTATIETSEPRVDGPTASITFEPLANGVYSVAYRVVSKDGHTVQGSYKFTVADPSASSSTSASASPSPSADESLVAAPPGTTSAAPAPSTDLASSADDGGSNTGLIITIAAVVVVLLAVGGFLVARRRPTT